jgi:hypothetical protein
MRLILVHGRAQQGKDPAKLREAWLAGLGRGLAAGGRPAQVGVRVEFPFYGDDLARFMKELETAEGRARLRGAAPDGYREFYQAIVWQMAERAGVFDEVQAEARGGAAVERGPEEWDTVQRFGRFLSRRVPGLQAAIIKSVTQDVWEYLTRTRSVKLAIDGTVSAAIPRGEPCVVVSHSLGTVVAYEVLAAMEQPLPDVRLWVTAGSPLGQEQIRDRLRRPRGRPACVARWLNATDPRDVVALVEKLDARSFGGNVDTENITDIHNGGEPHSIERYLADSRVAAAIGSALGL